MSSRSLYRLSGGVLIVGSLLVLLNIAASDILYPGHHTTPQQLLSITWLLVELGGLVGSLLVIAALPGMYLRQAGRAKAMGLIGFILLFFGLLLAGVAFTTTQIIALPYLAHVAPKAAGGNGPIGVFLILIIAGFTQIIGTILLGIATLRARMFSRWVGILLISSGILYLLTLPPLPDALDSILEILAFATLSGALAWCGYTLITGEREVVETTSFASSGVQAGR